MQTNIAIQCGKPCVLTALILMTITATYAHSADEESGADLPTPEIVTYTSDGLELKGFLFKPAGDGPFPVVIYNHGSEKEVVARKSMAKYFMDHGFVYFRPVRRGHNRNPGEYIVDHEKAIRAQFPDRKKSFELIAKGQEQENDDVVAAINWIKKQTYVDTRRIIVAGGSYGGIQTLLTAERDASEKLGVLCFITMGPAAESWSPLWADRLTKAVNTAAKPIFLMQARNDYQLGPSEVLGPLLDKRGLPNRHKLYPVHGDANDHAQGHGQFFNDTTVWGSDVLAFLKDVGALAQR